jgi:hypothetical protein
MSLLNSVGIDPASASERSFHQMVDSFTAHGKISKWVRTVQIVPAKIKGLHVDELAKFGGN